jgi:CO/xanthine dehydrogenase FAD-binding subunit
MTCVRPKSLDEAVRALTSDPGLLPVAGCTDLMVSGGPFQSRFNRVIDLLGIPELFGIRRVDDAIEIGAATTFTTVASSALVRETLPILADAAHVVGGWQIQNRATIGGNMANASPAGDSLPVLLALDAMTVVAGPAGRRELPYDQFHVGYRRTALQPGELIASVRIPIPRAGSLQRFRKVGTREAQSISKVVVAMCGRAEDGRIAEIRIGAGSVAATPVRLREAERAATGKPIGNETAATVGRTAAQEVKPIDDVRSTAAYRSHVLERVVRRMIAGWK